MSRIEKARSVFHVLWTLLALLSALPILGMVVGGAAWNGINVAVAICLILSIGGVLGLLTAFPAAFRHDKTYARIALDQGFAPDNPVVVGEAVGLRSIVFLA